MISIYPTIYHEFQCKANRCENTCCQLWTIDIDEHTAERYHSMTGSLGESLQQAITVDDEGSHSYFPKHNLCAPYSMKMDCVRLYSNWAKKDFATPAICIRAFINILKT